MSIAATASGCAPTYVTTTEPLRKAVRVVCISKLDVLTEGTAQQVEANNLAIERLNGGRTRCK